MAENDIVDANDNGRICRRFEMDWKLCQPSSGFGASTGYNKQRSGAGNCANQSLPTRFYRDDNDDGDDYTQTCRSRLQQQQQPIGSDTSLPSSLSHELNGLKLSDSFNRNHLRAPKHTNDDRGHFIQGSAKTALATAPNSNSSACADASSQSHRCIGEQTIASNSDSDRAATSQANNAPQQQQQQQQKPMTMSAMAVPQHWHYHHSTPMHAPPAGASHLTTRSTSDLFGGSGSQPEIAAGHAAAAAEPLYSPLLAGSHFADQSLASYEYSRSSANSSALQHAAYSTSSDQLPESVVRANNNSSQSFQCTCYACSSGHSFDQSYPAHSYFRPDDSMSTGALTPLTSLSEQQQQQRRCDAPQTQHYYSSTTDAPNQPVAHLSNASDNYKRLAACSNGIVQIRAANSSPGANEVDENDDNANNNNDDDDDDDDDDFKVCEWENCGNTFIDMGEFVKHLEDAHVNKEPTQKNRYYCMWTRCKRNGLEFNARYKLLIHMRVHSGEKPYECKYSSCSKSFSRLENLKIHERSHTGEKPYKCTYKDCPKSFTNSSDRIKHHKTHKDPKPYSCSHEGCTKRYTDPSSLRKHLRAHKRRAGTPPAQPPTGRGCASDFDPTSALLLGSAATPTTTMEEAAHWSAASYRHNNQSYTPIVHADGDGSSSYAQYEDHEQSLETAVARSNQFTPTTMETTTSHQTQCTAMSNCYGAQRSQRAATHNEQPSSSYPARDLHERLSRSWAAGVSVVAGSVSDCVGCDWHCQPTTSGESYDFATLAAYESSDADPNHTLAAQPSRELYLAPPPPPPMPPQTRRLQTSAQLMRSMPPSTSEMRARYHYAGSHPSASFAAAGSGLDGRGWQATAMSRSGRDNSNAASSQTTLSLHHQHQQQQQQQQQQQRQRFRQSSDGH